MTKFILIFFLSLFVLNTNALAKSEHDTNILDNKKQQAYKSFQVNADIVRLNHLVYWGELIEEYHNKTGKYPFSGLSHHDIYVEIATPMQQKYIGQKPPLATTKSIKEFVKELEHGLGRKIDEYYDPQYVPDDKPNFYIYMVRGDTYHLAVHTHQFYPFARKIDANYHKVEISNQTNRSLNILPLKTLLKRKDFQQAKNMPIEKVSFFVEREKPCTPARNKSP